MGGRSADGHRVVVIGAGIGGLVAALRLALRGLSVTLLDAAPEPGGKMRALAVGGTPVDAGPTVFTMRWVFDELLADAGARLEDLVTLQPLERLARHAWRGGRDRLDLFADRARSAEAIADFAGAAEARRFEAFCDEARRVYQRLEGPHIRSARPAFLQMVGDLGPQGLRELAALGPFASLWRSLGRHFHDPRLRQLFGRYATYCGGSPWLAPATLMLIAHVELEGVWSVDGGIGHFARALARLAQARGVQLRLSTRAEQIEIDHGRVRAVRLSGGERLPADSVVFNGDVSALGAGLLGDAVRRASPPPVPRRGRSLSALTWVACTRTAGFPLLRHNVFFDDDYASEFDDVFRQRRLPQRGTVYVCAQDRPGHDDAAPPDRERLLLLVNAPADGDVHAFDSTETEPCLQRSLALLRQCGLSLDLSDPSQVLQRSPRDFETLFPASGGALYGPATHGWMALFRRQSASTPVEGLYLAGGSVHPGPGMPMAAMSGRLAAATLLARLDSTSRSRRVRISGGTSTPSATTAATR